jgi:drug/metabolite transporter (DMT)-like permease
VPPRPSVSLPTILALTVAVLAVSSSAPLIAYAAAPALAIAFWRNVFATAVLVPAVAATRRPELTKLGWRGVLACATAGVALAGHFGTWIPSAKYTSIAAATALVATQPVWQGLIALGQGRRLPRVVWLGIGVAVAGAVVATGSDFVTSGRAFAGDLLALVGGLMAAIYTALGERARVTTSTTTYTAICYGTCALVLGVVCAAGGVRVHSYPAATWLAILAMTAGPQLLGHSMFNYALRRVAATTVSVLLLLEVPGAALLGWLWLGQAPRADELPGLALLVVGVAIVVLGARSLVRIAPNPPDGA